MARITNWYIPYRKKNDNWRDYLLYFLFFVYFIFTYLIGYILYDLLSYFFITGAFMVLLGVVFHKKFKKIASTLYFVGVGLILGIGIYFLNNLIFTVFILFSVITLILMFILLIRWVSRTQERLDIYINGNYSLKLVRKISSEIEIILKQNKWSYLKYGCTFQMDFDDKERIIIGLRLDTEGNESKYELILRTNRSRNSIKFLNIKKEILKLISNIEKNERFDNYPQIEKIICKKCRKKSSYNSAYDKFYCNNCNKLKEDKEVLISEKIVKKVKMVDYDG